VSFDKKEGEPVDTVCQPAGKRIPVNTLKSTLRTADYPKRIARLASIYQGGTPRCGAEARQA
jgi:hypothetical protein